MRSPSSSTDDYSRVVLTEPDEVDYINAAYIDVSCDSHHNN